MLSLEAKNRCERTFVAYRADLAQFISWLKANNMLATAVDQVERVDITEYLAALGRQGISGVTAPRRHAQTPVRPRPSQRHHDAIHGLIAGPLPLGFVLC